jgi:peptidoglycan/LPS O-acetylase OafA/YrhL
LAPVRFSHRWRVAGSGLHRKFGFQGSQKNANISANLVASGRSRVISDLGIPGEPNSRRIGISGTQKIDNVEGESALYIPALDGLRFVAFLFVLMSHISNALPADRGWIGVEVFFVISSFLFFHLLNAEYRAIGRIDIFKFFARRLLRIYPLMMLYSFLMFIIFSPENSNSIFRLVGLALLADNLVIWVRGYNTVIPFAAHLWTLSYEFQIYLIIPIAYLIYRRCGASKFLIILCLVWLICLIARAICVAIGVKHPVIWVTPFLRPESTLLGIAISLGILARIPIWVVCGVLFVAATALVLGPNVDVAGWWNIALYPISAAFAGALLRLALAQSAMTKVLNLPVMNYLGRISFGLYVYHLLGRHLATLSLSWLAINSDTAWYVFGQFSLTLAITVVLATISYFAFERWFLSAKRNLAIVVGKAG